MTMIQDHHETLVAAGRHAEAEKLHAQLGRLIDVMHNIRQGNRKQTHSPPTERGKR